MKSGETIKCPCCGQTTVGEYEICDLCSWENDPIQLDDPEYSGGANRMSLNEAREAFKKGVAIV